MAERQLITPTPVVKEISLAAVAMPKAKAAAEKRKTDPVGAMPEEPAVKEARVIVPQVLTETESDASADARPIIAEAVGFNPADTTLNVVQTLGGQVLASLAEAGMQFLVAGARANVGVSSGRYMFEAKVLEFVHLSDSKTSAWQKQAMRPFVRVGVSAGDSSLVLSGARGVYMDTDGAIFAGLDRQQAAAKFGGEQTVGVLVNMDKASANANTVSFFVGGKRVSAPVPIPKELHGVPLYPHVSYRNAKVNVMLGSELSCPPSFKCRSWGSAADADTVKVHEAAPADGKHEVVFPVALPGQGTFDWIDGFLKKNPHFVELSDRKLIQWAVDSGLPRQRQNDKSIDRPAGSGTTTSPLFGIPAIDEGLLRRAVRSITPLVPRSYLVAEAKANLLAAERKELVQRFTAPAFRPVAHVLMGEPDKDFVESQHEKMLEAKRRVAEAKWKEDKSENKGEKAPEVELSEADKKTWFAPQEVPDVETRGVDISFANFSVPSVAEGFADVRHEWAGEEESRTYLREWILKRKQDTRLEDLQPSEFFKTTLKAWKAKYEEWKTLQKAVNKKVADAKKGAGSKEADKDQGSKDEEPDINSAEDICDIGDGVPLFKDFEHEDWALLSLRFELFLLQAAFKADVADPDRPGVPKAHFTFYYAKYFGKGMNLKSWGVETEKGLVHLVKEGACWKEGVLSTTLTCEPTDFERFVKLTEEARRDRQLRISAGDETSRLKITPSAMNPGRTPIVANSAKPGLMAPGTQHRKLPPAPAPPQGLSDVPSPKGCSKGSGGSKGSGSNKKHKNLPPAPLLPIGQQADSRGSAWGKGRKDGGKSGVMKDGGKPGGKACGKDVGKSGKLPGGKDGGKLPGGKDGGKLAGGKDGGKHPGGKKGAALIGKGGHGNWVATIAQGK